MEKEIIIKQTVRIEIVAGVEGNNLVIENYRVAGPKAWGGGNVVKTFSVNVDRINRALESIGLKIIKSDD